MHSYYVLCDRWVLYSVNSVICILQFLQVKDAEHRLAAAKKAHMKQEGLYQVLVTVYESTVLCNALSYLMHFCTSGGLLLACVCRS